MTGDDILPVLILALIVWGLLRFWAGIAWLLHKLRDDQ